MSEFFEGPAPVLPAPAASPRPMSSNIAPRKVEVEARKRKRGTDETIHTFTIRCRVEASNRFVEWCEDNRLSYREGFDELVALLDREG